MHAIIATSNGRFNKKVVELENDANAGVAEAAKSAAKKLHLKELTATNRVTIKDLKYEDVVAGVKKDKGDAELGELLFKKQNCINCHTISKADPPKGPYLGDIANRLPARGTD